MFNIITEKQEKIDKLVKENKSLKEKNKGLTYQEYLFGELLALYNKTYAEMVYDTRFNLLPILYQEFAATPYNKSNKSEYDCINDYLKNRNYKGTLIEIK